jgi:hypothetical protein
METTRAVLCVLLGGVMVLIPVLFLVLLLVMPGTDRERHPRIVIVTALMAAALRVWYAPPGLFTIGSLLLAYGVAALVHASRAATRSAVGSILLWAASCCGGSSLCGYSSAADEAGPPNEIVC